MGKRRGKRTRPYWQTEPCPSWCWHNTSSEGRKDHHTDEDHPEDRCCFSHWQGTVTLTLLEPYVYRRDGRCDDASVFPYPAEVQLSVQQAHREVAPRVVLLLSHLEGQSKDHGVDLTVAEAKKLLRKLAKAVQLAESA